MFGNQTFLWLLEMVFLLECSTITLQITDTAGFSPESKSMHTIFHKIFENLCQKCSNFEDILKKCR